MDALAELLDEMRGRVPKYVGSNSIVRFAAYLRGYRDAMRVREGGRESIDLREFQLSVEKRFNMKVSRAWEDIILFHSLDDSEAMNTFWELMDKFRRDREPAKT